MVALSNGLQTKSAEEGKKQGKETTKSEKRILFFKFLLSRKIIIVYPISKEEASIGLNGN